MKNIEIRKIHFPNTEPMCLDPNYSFEVGKNGVTEITKTSKNGEMAEICWLQIWKGNNLYAEIKESVCHIFYKKEQSDENK
jgi:hypothetical protein